MLQPFSWEFLSQVLEFYRNSKILLLDNIIISYFDTDKIAVPFLQDS